MPSPNEQERHGGETFWRFKADEHHNPGPWHPTSLFERDRSPGLRDRDDVEFQTFLPASVIEREVEELRSLLDWDYVLTGDTPERVWLADSEGETAKGIWQIALRLTTLLPERSEDD